MPRAMWKGAIAFGLVNIPVELHTGSRDTRPHFRMLHAKDLSPIRFDRVCQQEQVPVPWNDLVRGYEVERGRFVTLTDEDFKAAALEKSKTIDILDFVEAGAVDSRYLDRPYYLTTTKAGERGYAVLREAIRDSGRIGVATIILRESQHLAALNVVEDALVLTLMRFADELADLSEFQFPSRTLIRDKELEMAKLLVDSLAGSWQPEKYHDEYRANLMRVIREKLKGARVEVPEVEEPRPTEVVDLMERLRQSLGPARQRAGQGDRARADSRAREARRAKRAAGPARPRRATGKRVA